MLYQKNPVPGYELVQCMTSKTNFCFNMCVPCKYMRWVQKYYVVFCSTVNLI